MNIDATRTLGSVVEEIPGASRILERIGLDYCCGGRRTLSDACQARGLRVEDVLRLLQDGTDPAIEPRIDWHGHSMGKLIDHIVDTHHRFTRQELERLLPLADKVLARHGEHHPELAQVRELCDDLAHELEPHMAKEEQVLFPYIRSLESPRPALACLGNVRFPIQVMMREHDAAGDLLSGLRRLTRDYSAPDGACRSFRALYEGLADLERDLHQHIHLENNILFPSAIRAER